MIISSYFIGGYCLLSYEQLLVVILLMVINGYYIDGY